MSLDLFIHLGLYFIFEGNLIPWQVKQVPQVPQPNEEVSQPGEVTYAPVFHKTNNLNNG